MTYPTDTELKNLLLAEIGDDGTLTALSSVAVVTPGTGYTTVPTVGFSGGGGTGAAATAVLSALTLARIDLTGRGSGYINAPTVAITGGGGSGATAIATTVLDTMWNLYSPWNIYTTYDGRFTVQYIKTKISAIGVLMGVARKQFTFSKRDRKLELGKLFDNLLAMQRSAIDELGGIMSSLQNGSGITVDQMDAQAVGQFELPIGSWAADPTDSMYTGNPIRPPYAGQRT